MKNEEFFKKRGFGHNLGFGEKPALCVIDMMRAFTDPVLPFGMNQEREIKKINQLLSIVHARMIPVFFSVVRYEEENLADAGWWFLKQTGLITLKAGTAETEIDPRIQLGPRDSIIKKKFASVFFGTDIISRLNYLRIDTLIITGGTTSGCVRATAVDAIQYGLRPIVVYDAVSDRASSAHIQSLFDLQMKYADCVNTKNVIRYLKSIKKEEKHEKTF